jgi:ABC-type uncharacterized transport system substrate-binding protein
VAVYVDKIREGAKSAELPAEQLTRLELLIDPKGAGEIGVVVPSMVLAFADEVAE